MHRAARAYAASQRRDDDALIRQFTPVIDMLARRIAGRTQGAVSPGDLWSAGALGLLEAAARFDASRAVKFESFVEHRIRGAMLDELRKMDHLPRRMRDVADKVADAKEKLTHRAGGNPPDVVAIAEEVGIDPEEVAHLEGVTAPAMPLVPELQLAFGGPAADERYEREETAHRLAQAVSKLPERLATLVSLYYVEGLTYREIARALELSEARVCQLHAEAMRLLRDALAEVA